MENLIIPSLWVLSAISFGGAWIIMRSSVRQPIRDRLRGVKGMESETRPSGLREQGVEAISRVGNFISSGGVSEALRRDLQAAGFHTRSAATIYLGFKIVLFIIGLSVLGLAASMGDGSIGTRVLLVLIGSMALFFLPNLYVSMRKSARRAEVRRVLPDVVDLLEVCVSAGMGLDMAWNAVSDEIRSVSNLVADEMALTNLEMHLGADRASALRHMAERTGADELNSLVAVLVQSDRFGTSIGEALRIFASSMRQLRSQRAEEQAETMSLKMLFPMIFFIFPTILIVAVGPAIITLAQIFGE